MARNCPQFADGIRAAYVFNRQLRAAEKGWSSSLGVGRCTNYSWT